jgi:hypothetical protein
VKEWKKSNLTGASEEEKKLKILLARLRIDSRKKNSQSDKQHVPIYREHDADDGWIGRARRAVKIDLIN